VEKIRLCSKGDEEVSDEKYLYVWRADSPKNTAATE
jgi:hypothetical protein